MPRPFFSLVIPCYNEGQYVSGQYLDRLLDSITESNLDYDDIEIIIADDHSPKSYTETIDKFKRYFPIKQIETEYQFGPGNTRQVGTMIATGEWLCFADHDDTFYPRALHTVKDLIQNAGRSIIFAYADFDKVSKDDLNVIVEKFRDVDNNALYFVHGKFYNLSKFWKPSRLHFPKDLKTHEDVALGRQVICSMKHLDASLRYHIPTPVYRWTDNDNSISNQEYQSREHDVFLERAWGDFLRSGIGQFIECFENGFLNQMELAQNVIPFLYGTWFQLNAFQIQNPKTYRKENFNILQDYWKKFKKATQFSTPILRIMMNQLDPNSVAKIAVTAQRFNLLGLNEWIDLLDGEETKNV